VDFCSDILGEFNELFRVELKGAAEPLTILFKGCVIGPSFHFDLDSLDFGLCSYDITKPLTCTLANSSDISMTFSLRIPKDNVELPGGRFKTEFIIEPDSGTLAPNEERDIEITLTSTSVKVYEDYGLTIDVDRVGDALLTVPIVAECRVPDIQPRIANLQLDNCFLRCVPD